MFEIGLLHIELLQEPIVLLFLPGIGQLLVPDFQFGILHFPAAGVL